MTSVGVLSSLAPRKCRPKLKLYKKARAPIALWPSHVIALPMLVGRAHNPNLQED